jgi:MarR family transcriptional regulator, transcriptional regulator for hemolysin
MGKIDRPVGMVLSEMMHGMFRVLKRRVSEKTEEKLTVEQFGLLYAISREENEVIQKDVAEIMGKDKSAILRMIDMLEEKELVRRVVDKIDRRKNNLMVTKKGSRAIVSFLEVEMELNRELMEDLPVSDLEAFYRVVSHVKTRAENL